MHMAKKTEPTGVRFDPEQLDFIKGREKIESPQKVVNFLLKAYWDAWHVPKNPFNISAPREDQKEEPVQKSDLPPYEAYRLEIKNAGSIEEIKKAVSTSAKDSDLAGWQKEIIRKYGIEVSQTLDF